MDLELVVFDLEEDGMLGGAEHVRLTQSHNVDLRGMVSLEMLGYCDHAPGSQSLPRSLIGLYPDTGNFIAVIGNQNSGRLIERFAEGMRNAAGLPVDTHRIRASDRPVDVDSHEGRLTGIGFTTSPGVQVEQFDKLAAAR